MKLLVHTLSCLMLLLLSALYLRILKIINILSNSDGNEFLDVDVLISVLSSVTAVQSFRFETVKVQVSCSFSPKDFKRLIIK